MVELHQKLHKLKFLLDQGNGHFSFDPTNNNSFCVPLVFNGQEPLKAKLVENFFKFKRFIASLNYDYHSRIMHTYILFTVPVKACVGCTFTVPHKDIFLCSNHDINIVQRSEINQPLKLLWGVFHKLLTWFLKASKVNMSTFICFSFVVLMPHNILIVFYEYICMC